MAGIVVYTPTGPLIPVWFYSFSATAYFIAALISFLVSYFAYRNYRISSSKSHLLLSLSFLALGLAFSILTSTSLYTYFYQPYLKTEGSLVDFNTNGFNLYYLFSLAAYLALVMMYLPKMKKQFSILFVPLWYINFASFHVTSLLLVGYVVLRAAMNFFKQKNLNSLLVLFSFSSIEIFHLLLYLTGFDVTLYLAAHGLLAVGFASLLFVLIRVSRK